MIQRMQRRLTAVLLLFLLCVYVGFCAVSYFASVRSMERSGEMMFHNITQPAPPTDGPPRIPGQVGMPYFRVDLSPDGTVLVAEQGQFALTEDEIAALSEAAMTERQDRGYLDEYGLRYFREATTEGWRLFFADDSMRREAHSQQIRNNVLLGLVLLPVFFLFSRSISAFIVRPVKRAWEQQTQFVADASHELKTPLTVILSNTDMILADCGEADGDLRRRANYVREEAGRMRGLVLELLNLARSDAAPRRRPVLSKVDLSAVAETAVLSFEALAYESGLTLDSNLEDSLMIQGDESQASQLLRILLDNAVKYSAPGGTISVALTADRGKHALLTVSNPSERLDKEQLRKLFDRFYRADEARSLQPGYGLGLSVARSIVTAWGGKIWAEHTGGRTIFSVRLPLSREK